VSLARLLGTAALAAVFYPWSCEAATHRVVIEGMKYSPERISVRVGDTIVWTNKDVVPHTVTAAERKLESGQIDPGKSWSHVARLKGEMSYICRFHPGMKGVFVVK
jgi:plastocyanin